MIKKKVILADSDELYLQNLSNYLMEKAPQLELITFTRADKLIHFLEAESPVNMLVIDEAMLTPQILKLEMSITRIVLSTSMDQVEGFSVVKKYQKSESLLNEILLKYAEDTGGIEAIQGKSNTKIASFYSPAGGCEKTTLALALAAAASYAGQKVLYLNLEEIDSLQEVLPATPGNLSEIFLALKTKGMNVGIKLSGGVGKASVGGFYYLSGVESISEHNEVSEKEMEKLIDSIRLLSGYDMVILDLSSAFSAKNLRLMELSDVVFCPILFEETSMAKMRRLAREADFHDRYHSLFGKMRLLVNRSRTGGIPREMQNDEVFRQYECVTVIADMPAMGNYGKIIGNEAMLRQMMNPLLQITAAL